MQRNYKQYPNDENGNILWGMHENGDNLKFSREIDFSIIFPTEDDALNFAIHLLQNGQKVSFSGYEGNAQFPWQVQAHPVMVPTHENVTGYENLLAESAIEFGGRNDGWACFSQD